LREIPSSHVSQSWDVNSCLHYVSHDFNCVTIIVQIGKEDIYYPTIGKRSLHDQSNANGQKFINFAASRGVLIVGNLFPHKKICKGTWKAPDGQTINQIDHMLIDVRHKSNLMDVRSLRGANTDSDHFLVLSKILARICNCQKESGIKIKKYNIKDLNDDDTALQYKQKLDNELSKSLVELVENSDDQRGTIKTAIITTSEETLGVIDKAKAKD
jgi:hypothetical protein